MTKPTALPPIRQPAADAVPAPVDALFTAMGAIYGMQKVGAMWIGADQAVVLGTWAEALAPFRPRAIEAAARQLPHRRDEDGRRIAWPPTLPEFLDAVEAEHRAILRAEAQARALAAPPGPPESPLVSPERARQLLRQIPALADRLTGRDRIH
jgi:hypothetical protein